MIRDAGTDDVDAIVDLAVGAGMFDAADRSFLASALQESLTEHAGEHRLVVDSEADGRLDGVAYFQPKPAADRVWDLTMIAVRPDIQGAGVGSKLLRHVEDELRRQGQRLLLIETSSTGQFDRTREFYRRRDYREEAVVRDYWADGDDLVLFRKTL
jgi:ribosomal protein S18 acetylase RimI-like enzyme